MDNIVLASPKVFISYAWENEGLKSWVKRLATELRNDGVDAKLDQWEVVPGDQMPIFMEKSVRENNYVLLICTPKYKLKSEDRIGGVGYEGDIMTAEILQQSNHRKFIPILQSGSPKTSIPSWLTGKYFIDFSNPEYYGNSFESLLRTFFNIRETAPPLGDIPVRFHPEIAKTEKEQIEHDDQNVHIDSIAIDKDNVAVNTSPKTISKRPFVEIDLVWHGGARSPRGYSNKNPTETDENGRLVTIIGGGIKPIIFWDLHWRFDFNLHNNSSVTALNIKIKSIGTANFTYLEKLAAVNNIKPFDKLTLNTGSQLKIYTQ